MPENDAANPGAAADPESDETEHRLISAAKAYLTSHIPDATLERTALTAGLSPSYFSRLFHRVTGETFSDFLMRLRMETAARLLSESDLKLLAGTDTMRNYKIMAEKALQRYGAQILTSGRFRESLPRPWHARKI